MKTSARRQLAMFGACCGLACALVGVARGAETAPAWKPHDLNRPRPPVRDPGPPADREFAPPPAGAVVLFDGHDWSAWERRVGPKHPDQGKAPKWKAGDGYGQVVPGGGDLVATQVFGSCRIHIEWAAPADPKPEQKGQNRGNSGVFLPGHQEVQVLDSYGNDTYPDGQAAAIYGKYPPLANVCRKPGEWQSYDITLEQPRYDAQRKLVEPCRVTVVHNGIVVQDRVDLGGGATEGRLSLQDHNHPVRYRNIWVLPLNPEP